MTEELVRNIGAALAAYKTAPRLVKGLEVHISAADYDAGLVDLVAVNDAVFGPADATPPRPVTIAGALAVRDDAVPIGQVLCVVRN